MSENQFNREKYAAVVWNIINAATTDVDCEHFLEWSAPTEELANRARAMLPNVYSNQVDEWAKHNLTRLAIMEAFEGLLNLRREKLDTHMRGSAAGFLFKKTLAMYSLHLLHPSGMNPIEQGFEEIVEHAYSTLQRAFDPVFETLAMDERQFTKREKHALLRAFWPAFASAFEDFRKNDPYELAIVMYEAALNQVKIRETSLQGVKE